VSFYLYIYIYIYIYINLIITKERKKYLTYLTLIWI